MRPLRVAPSGGAARSNLRRARSVDRGALAARLTSIRTVTMTISARRRSALLAPAVIAIVIIIAMWVVACAAQRTASPRADDAVSGSGSTTALVADQRGFEISGSATTTLFPGGSSPIDVRIANSHDSALSVSHLEVAVESIGAPRATRSLPCLTTDFTVVQIDRPIEVDAGDSISLSQLGWPESHWPHLHMLDTDLNQDGCIGAELRLVVHGVGALIR